VSRMIAFLSPVGALSSADALGGEVWRSFLALSSLHRDGWGIASVGGRDGPDPCLDVGPGDEGVAMSVSAAAPAVARLHYLRFASAGSAVRPENLQPFAADGVAFAHNGALVPRAAGLDALPAAERMRLRGDTDSEVYAAHVRLALGAGGDPAEAVAAAVAGMRARYPAACLNALVLVDGRLLAVHSAGTVLPPWDAFARRGATTLPPGHDADYNVLSAAVLPSGVQAVATRGVAGDDWRPLPPDTVTRFAPGAPPQTVRIPHAPGGQGTSR
jgi:glutamine amidotransferase